MIRIAVLVVCLLSVSSAAFATDWSSARYFPSFKAASTNPVDPKYQEIFQAVSKDSLMGFLKSMTGYASVTAGGKTFFIKERYSPQSKALFRAYWSQYFQSLGMATQELAFHTQQNIGENQGHNLEAILPGQSKDSIVIIVHYDSTGPWGQETSNPGVDDDMTGMATMLETARILALHKSDLKYTVRFVAADYEELGGLEGAREYALYVQNLSKQQGFKLVAAVDNEQSGWNCAADSSCRVGGTGHIFDVFSCSNDSRHYNSAAMGDALAAIASTYSPAMSVNRGCIGENSDHYAMWEIGVPAVVFSEHSPFNNPHFDQSGGDTLEKIDQDYFFRIAQIGVTFAASLAIPH